MTQPRKPGGRSRSKTPRARAAATPEPAATAAVVEETQAPRVLARIPMPVRWGDLDAFNHVNNATFLVYAQEARLAWLAEVDGTWFDETMMPVVAAAQINFRRQLAWPAQIVVELGVRRIGNSSLTITHRIVAADDAEQVYADGEVVMVWVDPASGRSVALPEAIRSACQSPEASGATTSK
jgi:acyl-CoA thioester hydrolase